MVKHYFLRLKQTFNGAFFEVIFQSNSSQALFMIKSFCLPSSPPFSLSLSVELRLSFTFPAAMSKGYGGKPDCLGLIVSLS